VKGLRYPKWNTHPALGGLEDALLRKIAPALVFLLVAGTASATLQTSSFTFLADGLNTPGNEPVKAQADFTFNNLTLTVTLTNLLANPSNITQSITDFDFQLLDSLGHNIIAGCNATAGVTNCLTGATAPSTVTIASGGGFSVTNTAVNPNWAFTLNSGVFLLNRLANGPAMSIIGPPAPGVGGTYSAAGGSIAGNGAHNPFINQTATWTFTIPNLVTNGPVTPAHIVFSFGTAGDQFFCITPADCGGGGGGQGHPTPEPLTFALVGGGLIGMYFIRRRRPGSR
jgi:PEP-CTERM motif